MTCIVALKHAGRVYMGSDSAGVSDLFLTVRNDPKIYRVGPALLGFTTSFRMGQLLGHALTIPERMPSVPLERFMVTSFVDAVRDCLKAGGYARKENDVERGGTFLVAIEGRIFHVYDDYQVGENAAHYDACGCGYELALGSLCTTQEIRPLINPEARIEAALSAAEQWNAGVRQPFLIETLEPAVALVA